MTGSIASIEISDRPDLLRLAEEVRDSGEPRVLRRGDEDVAVVMPVGAVVTPRLVPPITEFERQAFLASAGEWGVRMHVDEFVEDNAESRRLSSRPPAAV